MHHLSGIEIRDKFLNGEYTATEIATYFLKRAEQHNEKLGAFLSILKEKALSQAKLLDEKKARGEPLGKLAAIPMAIKDNIHIKGEITTCASKFLENYRAPFDATVTKLLEQEGAIFIGKTNLDEFAMGSSTEKSAFFPTRNPWNLECVPGGSSGGSSAAVAARLCPIAFGSDTGGSIRQPASLCGLVGFKPTYGRISRFGLVAFGSSFDQIGPFTTTTADAALIMEVIGTPCDRDSTSIPDPAESYLDKMDGNVKGMTVGVPFEFLKDLKGEGKRLFEDSVETLKSLGCKIIDVNLDTQKYGIAAYYILAPAEASTNLARFDGIRYGLRSEKASTLDEVYDMSKEEGFGKEVKSRILLGTHVLSSGFKDAYYKKAQKVRTLMIRQYQEAFKSCDIIAMPVCPGTAFKLGANKSPLDLYLEDVFSVAANLTGCPAISVPAGFSKENLPVGVQFIGPQKKDTRVFNMAKAFEQAKDFSKVIPEGFKE